MTFGYSVSHDLTPFLKRGTPGQFLDALDVALRSALASKAQMKIAEVEWARDVVDRAVTYAFWKRAPRPGVDIHTDSRGPDHARIHLQFLPEDVEEFGRPA